LPVFFALTIAIGQTLEQSYSIKKGDTLWDLAFTFLGDPFQWSQIWHQNSYITNPDLIYPGNTLVIRGGTGIRQAATGSGGTAGYSSSAASSGTTAANGQDDFYSETKQALEQSEKKRDSFVNSPVKPSQTALLSDTLFKIAMEKKNYFTSDFLEQIGFLWFTKDEIGALFPGNASLRKMQAKEPLQKYNQEIYQQFDEVIIEPIGRASYRVGDTVDIYHSRQFVKFQGKTANVVGRVAKAGIRSVRNGKIVAVLYKIWDVIQSGDRVGAVTNFPSLSIDTLVEPDVVVKGTVFLRLENTERPYPYHTFILDRGSKDGVALGDIFSVASKSNPVSDRFSAIGCVVNAGETSSTLVIERLFDTIAAGDTATMVKRIRFKQ
jgi:hypothetical protein